MTHKDLMPGDKIRLTGWLHFNEDELFANEGNSFPCEVVVFKSGSILRCLKNWAVWQFTFEFISREDGTKPIPQSVFAAAPEMLEAMDEFISTLKNLDSVYASFPSFKKMEKAIKKAKGEHEAL